MNTNIKSGVPSQCIVLPLQEDPEIKFNGTGLALHFLLGNVIVLDTDLKECWFGWRVKKLFSNENDLETYCKDNSKKFDLNSVSRQQKVRFWLYGSQSKTGTTIHLYDGTTDTASAGSQLTITPKDDLVGFRTDFLDMIRSNGISFPDKQAAHALWQENISEEGLDISGRALLSFYSFSAFSEQERIDLDLFNKAVEIAPDSFMAQDILGWALYRNKAYDLAAKAFLKAIEINPFGVGAMAGLVWCGVYTGDKEPALKWAARKAEIRNEDIEAAKEKTLKNIKR